MIGFLHTSPVHVATFADLVAGSVAVVSERLLEQARRSGVTASAVQAELGFRLGELATAGASTIVCTCSTVGAAAEALGERVGLTVLSVDRPMAEVAVSYSGLIMVLATVESTLAPTEALLREVAGRRTPEISVRLVADAWRRFEEGDVAAYLDLICQAIVRAEERAAVVVLAQASMAPAADLVEVQVPVLSSPELAVRAAVALDARASS